MRVALRWARRLTTWAVLLFVALYLYVWAVSRRDEAVPADAIVVLGAAQYNGRPSPALRARLEHARELYRGNLAPTIVVTGGMASGDTLSEATVSQLFLVELGVPSAAIVVQPIGRDTRESMEYVAAWAAERRVRIVLLVSDPFHMARLGIEARGHDLVPHPSPTRTSPLSVRWTTEARYLAAEAVKLPIVWLRHLVGTGHGA